MQLALLRREQGRPAEAELAVRDLEPGAGPVRAAILVDLGRDSQAWAEVATCAEVVCGASGDDDDWLADAALLGEVAAVLGEVSVARSLYARLASHEGRFAMDSAGSACHGSVARQLGSLAHRLDDWEEARRHYEAALAAHTEAGAPILFAHTCRQYAALLRVRGGPNDWDHAVELLADAERVYRRLGIERLAAQCQSVLARSDLTDVATAPGFRRVLNVFRPADGRQGDGWLVRYAGSEARLAHERGLQDLPHLLAHPAQSLHVADLLLGPTSPGVGTAATVGVAPVSELEDEARAEHRARLAELESEADRARRADDPIEVALASAELDRIEALLASEGDSLELARAAVATRVRLAVDAVERAHPELGRHLRRSIRTGTFCSYEPPSRTNWET
ncbi:MAG: tetratricopeptide repeat protein [Actinomycetota bacterium]|nr:tetratricopeptide repeat protein [Actinomycetota bacterium]